MKTFIQIGTNNGNDHFKELVSKFPEKLNIFLIEANKNLIPQIEFSYKNLRNKHNITISNVGIVADKSINQLNIYDDDLHSGFNSIIKRKSYDNVSGQITFEPCTMKEYCELHNITKIDFLFIDTEGYDYTIINSIDLNSIEVIEIVCEAWPYDEDSEGDIRTGPSYFEIIKEKLKDYEFQVIVVDGMHSYHFLKK
jgi:FkbM family methyltransferase